MPEIRGTYSYAEGLTPGKAEDGGLSGLLFDSGGASADRATFYPDIDPDNDDVSRPLTSGELSAPPTGALIAVAFVVLVAGAVAAPKVIRRLKDRRRKAIEQKRSEAMEPKSRLAAALPLLIQEAVPLPSALSTTATASDKGQ